MKITWTCHICGDERPEERISVMKHPLIISGQIFPNAYQNVRYCNDRRACMEGAVHFRHVPDSEEDEDETV